MQKGIKWHFVDFLILGIAALILVMAGMVLANGYQDANASSEKLVYAPLQFRIRLRYCPLGMSELLYEGCELMESSKEIPLGTVLAVEDVHPSPYFSLNQQERKYEENPAEHCEDIDLLVQGSGCALADAVYLEEKYELRIGDNIYVRILSGGMATGQVTWIERKGAET